MEDTLRLGGGEAPRFLDRLSDDERQAFRAAGRAARFGAGETAFREGDDPGGVLAIERGRMKVSIAEVAGREVVVGFPGPGELIGELAALSGRPRSATVTAVTDLEVVAVRAPDFQRFIATHDRVVEVVLGHVTGLLAKADRQCADLATRDVTGRVAGRLLQLVEEVGDPVGLRLSQGELAAWAGASREEGR